MVKAMANGQLPTVNCHFFGAAYGGSGQLSSDMDVIVLFIRRNGQWRGEG